MQLLLASSSSSSSSHSSGSERHSCEPKGVEKFERMHLHSLSPPPPPPPPHFKGKKHRHVHGRHSPPPPRRHHHQSVKNEHRHHSPLCSFHCEKDKLRVKPPKPSKKVRKLHHKLMKACKLPKGAHHHYYAPPAPDPSFYGADAVFDHPPGCCLHYHGMSMADERPAEERHLPSEVGVRHHGHLRRRRGHHNGHPCVIPEIRCGTAVSSQATPGEPPVGAGAPPPSAAMLLADEPAPATQAPY